MVYPGVHSNRRVTRSCPPLKINPLEQSPIMCVRFVIPLNFIIFKFTNPGMVSMAQSVDLSIATIIEHAGKNCFVQIPLINSRTDSIQACPSRAPGPNKEIMEQKSVQ